MAKKYWWEDDEQQDNAQQEKGQRYWWDDDSADTVGTNITNRVNTWLKNHNTYISNYNKRYSGRKNSYEDAYVSDSSSWLDTVTKQKSAFDAEADSILAYMDRYKGYLDADWMEEVRKVLTDARGTQSQIIDITTKDNEWWSGFGSEELVKQYGSAEEAYKYYQRAQGYNTKYAGATGDEIQQAMETLGPGEEYDWLRAYRGDVYGNTIRANADFQDYATIGSGLSYTDFGTQTMRRGTSRRQRSTTTIDKYRAASLALAEHYGNEAPLGMYDKYDSQVAIFRTMEDEEFENLAYCIAYDKEHGTNTAEQYVDLMEETLSYRRGNQIGSKITNIDIPVIEGLAALGYGALAGVDNFAFGIEQRLSDKEVAYYPSYYANAHIGEQASGLDSYLHSAATNIGNMAPSILVSATLSGLGVPGKVSEAVGSATMGFSASGNAYKEALMQGYDKNTARLYGDFVGASEGTLQYLLGGISKLGGMSSKMAGKVAAIDDALLRGAAKFGLSIGSEIMEEELQNFLEPAFRTILFGEDYDAPTISEIVETAIVTFLSTGFLEGGGTYKGIKQDMALDKQFSNDYGAVTGDLIQEGLLSDPNSESYKLAEKFQKQTEGENGKAMSGYQIRQLVEANDAQFAVEDYDAAVKTAKDRLTELGETNDVDKLAKLVAKKATGQELTRSEKKALVNSFGSRVAKEMRTASEQTATYKSLEDRVGTEGRFNVSESGQAVIRESKEGFDISKAEVVTVGDGQVTFKTESGTEVYAGDIDFADEDQSFLVSAVSDIENITPAAATAVMHDIVDTSKPLGAQLNGIDEAYTYGYYGYSVADLKAGQYVSSLTDKQMMSAYKLGESARKISDTDADAPRVKMRTAAEAKLSKKEKAAQQKARFESDDVEVYYMDGKTVTKFDEHTGEYDDKRTAAINTAKFLSKMGIGSKYYFFESYVNAAGERVYKDANGNEVEAPNGMYEADGSIYIDLNAGDAGQGTALFTMGHELGHFVKAQSTKQFKVLGDLVTEAFDKTDMSMHDRVVAKQEFLSKKRGHHVTYAEAYEEVVCDALSTMLTDGSFHEKIMEIKVKDKGLFNTIKRFFEKMIAKFKKVYAELTPDQKDAQDIRAMKDMFDRIQTAFAEALVEASDNFHAAMESVVEAKAEPVGADEIITDGAVVTDGEGERFSIRSMKHDIAEGKMFEDLKNVCGWTDAQVNTLRTQLKDLVEYMIPYRNILDMNESYGAEGRRFSPYKPNSDPLYKISMDFSTLCSKRLLTQYVIEQLQLRENRPMSAEEQMAIRDMLNEYRKVEKGLQVACAMCYVEAARLKSPKQIQRWLDDPAPLLKDYFGKKNKAFNDSVKKAQADFKESKGYDREAPKKDMKPADVKELNQIGPRMRSKYQLSAEEQAIVERAMSLPNSTYLTAGNLANLSETDPVIYDAYTAFVRTATRSKSLEKDEPYYYGDSARDNGNGIIVTDSFIEAVNRENGMRFSSWSDWRIQHLLDYITAVIDNSVRGAAMHGYTKFGDEVRVLGKTGMMFNMSGVAGTQTGLDEDGSLSFSPTESIDVNEAIQLREEFPEHAGLQCIGVSDAHIIALLRSDIIDYVIPYHVSGLNAALRRMVNIHGWADYTGTQHASIDKSIKLENAVDKEHWHEEPVFSEFFVGYDTGMTGIEAMRASAEKYKQMCKDRGLTPKFNQFATEDNYWKLLIDRKMINQKTGNLIRQKAVTPTFDFSTIKGVVDKFVENYDAGLEARALNHIVENWDSIPQRIKDLKKHGSTKTKKTAKAVDTLSNQTLAAQPAKNSDRQNNNRASNGSPLTRRSVKQRSVGSTHEKMSSTAAAEILGIENIAKYSDSVKEAVAVLGEFFTSVDQKKPVLGFKRTISASNLEGSLVSLGILKREGTSGSAYRYDDGHALRVSNHSANANNFVGDGEHLSIALFERGKMNDFVDGKSNVIEAVFRQRYLDGNPEMLKQVIHDIAHFIAEGEYHDTAGAMRYNFSGTEEFKEKARQRMAKDEIARGKKFSDRDYMAAVNSGDMETAQRMVDEAAKKAGYTTNGYHGSHADFTVVDGFLWTTRDRLVAQYYYGRNPNAINRINRRKAKGFTPNDIHGVYSLYYKLGNNLCIYADGASWGELPVTEDEYPGVYADEGTGDITTNAMAEWAERHGYDSITFVDVYDGGNSPTTVDVIFNPNRDAKSADPVTYDDNGNVIPLSERFNAKNDDIRYSERDSQGNTLSEDQKEYFADSKARDENGSLYVLYHGSRSPVFTEFDLYEGVWLTPDANYAETYADWTDDDLTGLESSVYDDPNSRIYKMYANITNPLDLGEINEDLDSTHIDRLAKQLGVAASKVEDIAYNYGYKYGVFVYDVTRTKEFIDIARERGFDGFVATEAGKKTFCAISSPNQVKLTTNEVPSAFNDIRYSERDSAGNQLTKEQIEFFKDSKVRDRDGNLLVMYHGSAGTSKFTVFERRPMVNGKVYGDGYYFTEAKNEAHKWGSGNIYEVYVNLSNPYYVSSKAEAPEAIVAVAREKYGRTYDRMSQNPSWWGSKLTRDEFIEQNSRMWNNSDIALISAVDESGIPDGTEAEYYGEVARRKTELLRSLGYDGVIVETNRSNRNFREVMAFDSNQIKSVDNKKPTGDPDMRFSERTNAPVFYSQMAKVVEGMKQEKFGASSVISMLRGRGVKAEEIRWSGIQAWLEGKKSVTKAELLEFIQGSMLHIEEETRVANEPRDEFVREWQRLVEYLDADEILVGLDSINDTMKPYLEELVEDGDLNQVEADHLLDLAHKAVNSKDLPSKWNQYKLSGGENYRELLFKMPDSTYSNQAMKGHWGDDAQGVLAHARIQDFNTFIGKMLFIEEIQSDWHNAGQKYGYGTGMTEAEKDAERVKIREEFMSSDVGKSIIKKVEQQRASDSLQQPFKDVNEVYDWIAFQPLNIGTDLMIEYPRWATNERLNALMALDEKISELSKVLTPDAPFNGNYHEYVLKRLLRMAAEEGYDSIGWTTADIQSQRWSEDYAEGYRIEYDQDIPKFLKKYGKQWGTTVGKTQLDNGTEVWSMAITDSMQESVLREGQALYSERTGDSVSNRSLLANAFEGITQNSNEYKMIQEYKGHIKELNELENKLQRLNNEIRKIRFGTTGPRDIARLREVENEAKEVAKEINRHDMMLLNLEASEPLRKVIERERKKEAQKTKDHVKEIQQSKKVRAEQTELRHKIRKAVRDLDKILNRGNKKLNVKEDVQGVVSKALKAADILFTENYGSYDMLRNGIGADLSDAEEALVATCTRMLKDLDKMPTDGYDNWQARQEAENKLRTKMSKLKDVFARERKRLNNTTVSSILGELADAYASLEKSEQSYVQGAYTEAVHNFLKNLQSEVGGTVVQDMTKDQLESVYAAYKMVLTTVRKANELFNQSLKMSREQLGNAVIEEVMKAGGTHGLWTKAEIARSQFDWNNMKPVWVANRIGSESFAKLMQGLFEGQYNFAVDIEEAKQFKLEMDKKYKPRNWDAEKQYKFVSSTGKEFSLNLQQIMSLYAFSKREQAYSHLLNGGFVFEGNSTVIVDEKGHKKTYIHNGATSYKLNEATLNGIINSLTAEQKAYVDEMQVYLSDVMGAKGNEVSMQLYGIKMFNERFYFPLRSSGAYMERAKEAELKKQQGQINLVNSGFTHSVKPEAKNPIILSGFMDVWAEHCNEMSMYHSMVLPMEDFRKVYNYSTVHDEKFESASVYQTIQDAYGNAATAYIDQLYRELNAGATVDPRETPFKARISKFKKAAVMMSASVVVQQFSAIGRAYALIDPKHFIGAKVNSDTKLSAAEEMKKYAPVAIIKEMGGFDTGTKGSAKSYIMAETYGKGERLHGLKKDEQYRSDLMGYLPAKADEKTWCAIWETVKRETKAKHPKMDVKSEEFLKLAGERFSEVIEKTQVYDSVLARSANMRSKGAFMAMATAFMAEPTTTVNLIEDAIRSGNKNHIARTFGAVGMSIVLNNALASIVYAMRDDDEDETFIEKYFQSFTSGMIDDFNPMSYYPFLKDVYSLFQGYDVERADMSVIADVRDAMKKVVSIIGKDTSEMDDAELAEHNKNVSGALMSLLDAGCSMFGVPFKNVRRDAKGIINAFVTASKDLTERDTTWHSFWDKVGAAAKDTIPVYAWTKDKAKADKLYDAIISGDKAYLARLKSAYKTDSAYQSAVRKALRENDPRIQEAAKARYEGRTEEYKRIFREIQKEGKFSFDDIMSAINNEENGLEPDKVTSQYGAGDFVESIVLGDARSAQTMMDDIIATHVANGKTTEEAEEAFASAVASGIRDAYSSGLLDEAGAENMLIEYAGKDEDEAASKVSYWAFCEEYPEYDFTESNVAKYHEFAEPAGVSVDVYAQFITGTKGLATIRDEWGDEVKSKREQVLEVIDSLPLTWQQKDALYLAAGYSENNMWDVPW